MSNRGYYYLISSLPKLRLDDYNEHYRLDNYIQDLKKHLTEEHFCFVQDILQKKERGLSAANMDDILQQQFYPPSRKTAGLSVDEFKKNASADVDKVQALYKSADNPPKPKAEALWRRRVHTGTTGLPVGYHLKMTTCSNEFIRNYFTFDRDLRNVLVALNKRKFNLDTDGYVGEQEDEVIQNLMTSSLSDFGLSRDLDYVPALIEHFQNDDIVSFQRYIDQLRWEKIDSINTFKYFSIDVLLGYLVKFMLVERWLALDVQSGWDIFKDRTKVSLATA